MLQSLNHATAQMNHKLAHQLAFHPHSISIPLPNPLLKRCPELRFTREQCEGFKKPLWKPPKGEDVCVWVCVSPEL